MLQRAAVESETFRGECLRASLGALRLGPPRHRMRVFALAWRQEVRLNGRSEVSETLLDMAVGWRSMDLGTGRTAA